VAQEDFYASPAAGSALCVPNERHQQVIDYVFDIEKNPHWVLNPGLSHIITIPKSKGLEWS